MTRTTPPRPLDVAAAFPELAPLARSAVRLHPRAGGPTAADSSIGGPLLWPAAEPWPVCPEHAGPWHQGLAPDDVRTRRRVLREAWARPRAEGTEFLTEDERLLVERGSRPRRIGVAGALPLLPVLQLHAADIPGLPRPDGTDLLQVLWCPFGHDKGHLPYTELRWRSRAEVRAPLAEPPRPAVIGNDSLLPNPCLVHPEKVREYPAPHELPEELADRVEQWALDRGADYQYDLAVAPGCKVGGHAPWSFTDPFPLACAECGAGMRPLLTLDSTEWDGGSGSWRPVEDATAHGGRLLDGPACATGLRFGRGYGLQLYVCERSYGHPLFQNVQ